MRRFRRITANNLGRQIVRRMTRRRPLGLLSRRPMVTTYRSVDRPLVWSFMHRAIGQARHPARQRLADENRIPSSTSSPGLQTLRRVRSALAERPPARPEAPPARPSDEQGGHSPPSVARALDPSGSQESAVDAPPPAAPSPTKRRPLRRTAVEITPRTEELRRQAVSDEPSTQQPETSADHPVRLRSASDRQVIVPESPPAEPEIATDDSVGRSEADDTPTVVLADLPPELRRAEGTKVEPDGIALPPVHTDKEESEREQPAAEPVAVERSLARTRPQESDEAKTVVVHRREEASEQSAPTTPSEDPPALSGPAPSVSQTREAPRHPSRETAVTDRPRSGESQGAEPTSVGMKSMLRREPEYSPDVSPPTGEKAGDQPDARPRSRPAARPPVESPEPASVPGKEVGDTAPAVDEGAWWPEKPSPKDDEGGGTAPQAASGRSPSHRATPLPPPETTPARRPLRPKAPLPYVQTEKTAVPPVPRRESDRPSTEERGLAAPLRRKQRLPVTTPTPARHAAQVSRPQPIAAQQRERAEPLLRRAETPSLKESLVQRAPAIGSPARRSAARVKPVLPVRRQSAAQPMPLVDVFDGKATQAEMPEKRRTDNRLKQSGVQPAPGRPAAEPQLGELVASAPLVSSPAAEIQRTPAVGAQRSAEEGATAEGSTTAAGPATAAGEGAAEAGEPKLDLDAVARQVYEILRRRLRVELERGRGSLLV